MSETSEYMTLATKRKRVATPLDEPTYAAPPIRVTPSIIMVQPVGSMTKVRFIPFTSTSRKNDHSTIKKGVKYGLAAIAAALLGPLAIPLLVKKLKGR